MIKTMMKVSGLSRAQLEAMGEEKFFAKYGQQLKQEMGGNLNNNTTPDPKKKSPDQLNREAYQRSLLQAQQETARERVQKNMQEVTDSSLWNLPGNVYMGIPKYGINLAKGAFNALKHNAKMLGLAQADNVVNEGVNQIKENYAMGGNMKQYAQGGHLTRFDEGGTHEENPLGGIPQGADSQGVMNTVEQGETKKGNYVYSDRLSIDENMAKQLNLPGYIKGKSFANASKAIDNKFRDRSDQYSQETKRTLLDRLKQGQEALKQQEQQKAQQLAQAMQANSQQSPGMGNNEVPPGMEQFMQSPQEEMVEGQASNPQEEMMEQPMEQPMAYGGMMNRYDGGSLMEVSPIGGSLKPAGQTLSGPTTMPSAAIPSAAQLNTPKSNISGTTGTGISGADALGYLGMAKSVADGDIKGAAMSGAQMAAAKGVFGAGAQNAMAAAGPALGVVGAGMGAYQLSEMAKGKGISRSKYAGAAQGALTGASAGMAFGLPGAIVGAGAGIAAGAAGHDGAVRNYGQDMGKIALAKNSVYNDPSHIKSQRSAYGGYLNQRAMGGQMNQYLLGGLFGGPTPLTKPKFLSNVNNLSTPPKIDPSSGSFKPNASLNLDSKIDTPKLASMKDISMPDYAGKFAAMTTNVPGVPNRIGKTYKPGFFSSSDRFIDKTPIFGDKYKTGMSGKSGMFSKDGTLGKAGEFIKENYGEMLNTAPALYNAYKAMNPETSDAVAYSRLGDTYKKSYIDRAALENINREETNNTMNALTNAAGGSNAALMGNYAAANAGRIKGRSDAYLKADAYDAEQNALKQEFDSGINIRNQAVDTAEKIAQAQNDATARNMNREYAAAAMEGIGKFGKQQFDKKQIARTLGYDYKGGYIVDKAGNRVSPEDLAKAQANAKKLYEDTTATQTTAYGGYLRTIKRMK